MRTEDLIASLAGDPVRVRLLPPPWRRAGIWLLVALPYMAAVIWAMSPRPDLAAQLASPRFLAEQGAALATAVAAAVAAFALVTPGANPRLHWLPVVPGALWLSTLGLGCVADWLGPRGLRLTPEPECLFYIALIGSLPAIVFVAMLRRGAPLFPCSTVAMAALAAAAIGNFGLRLFHMQDAALMVLVWQVGSVLLLAMLAGMFGRGVLRWPHRAR